MGFANPQCRVEDWKGYRLNAESRPRLDQKKVRNIAGSHRAKLLALARNRGEDFQFLLGRWVVERFLFRLAGSSQKDSFILKGATLFLAWEGQLHRPTKDLDLLRFGSPDVDEAARRIREVCAVPVEDGIVFDLAGIQGERIKEDAEYEGVRVRVPASLDGARISMQIDIGFGDLVDPPPAEITLPVLLPLRRALDEIAARRCAADEKRKKEAEQRQVTAEAQSAVVQ